VRILHLSSLYAPFSYGGAERVVEVLAEGQVAQGYDVAVASLVPRPTANGTRNGVVTLPLAKRNPLWIEESAGYPAPVRMLNKLCTVFNLPSAMDFGRVIEQFRPDIVHTHSLVELPPMVWKAARRRGVAVVHTLHDYDLLCIRAALFRHGKVCEQRNPSCVAVSSWKRRFHSNIDAVVAISKPVLDTHRARGFFQDLPQERQHVIWNPVPSAEKTGSSEKSLEGDFTFGFLGRIVPEKGIDVLLEACRRLPASGWKLKIAGTLGPEQVDWVKTSHDLPIEWLGRQKPDEFFSTIDVLVVPPIWMEPFGLTVVEAFGAGVPVIGARMGAIPDIIGRISEEWLVPSGDPQALADKMIEVMTRGRGGLPPRQSFSEIMEAVRPESIIDAYSRVYTNVIQAVS
jgi:glycosyltransferase involved in cell wall biosynthesis